MSRFDHKYQLVQALRNDLPQLIDLLQIEDANADAHWHNLDAKLLSLLDPDLPLMVAICGGANSGKSTLFNSMLASNLSPVRGDAGSTRRVLVAANPQTLERPDFVQRLFEPFAEKPVPLADAADLLTKGPPLIAPHSSVTPKQVLIDTPDFDTGSEDRYINREIAQEILRASNVLIYVVTNATYNNLENTRFMRQMLTEAGLRPCILVYNCSRTLTKDQAFKHLTITATNLFGDLKNQYLMGFYRTNVSDSVAAGRTFMSLRPVRSKNPHLQDLLGGLDSRTIREEQISTVLEAFNIYVRKRMSDSRQAVSALKLYRGAVQLALSYAVQQALVTLPLERIMRRMNEIWLDTSPEILKFFRAAGTVIGKPAQLLLSLIKPGKDKSDQKQQDKTEAKLLEALKLNLIQAATDLREKVLADEIVAETTVNDPQGAELIRLKNAVGQPTRLNTPDHSSDGNNTMPGTVTIRAVAPAATVAIRQPLSQRPWLPVAEQIGLLVKDILDVASDKNLDQELSRLVNRFRKRMNFAQRTRESLFASLNILPATLGIAYIISTGDPVGGSGIYAKLHGLFGMHDLWALVSIPATERLDAAGRKDLTDMLGPIVGKWLDSRAVIVQAELVQAITGEVMQGIQKIVEHSEALIEHVTANHNQLEDREH